MKTTYIVLIIAAAVVFAVAIIIKLFMGGIPPADWLAPQTLWRGAMGGVGFAMVLLLMEIRDLLKAKN